MPPWHPPFFTHISLSDQTKLRIIKNILLKMMTGWQQKEEEEAEVEMWKYVFGFTNMAVVKCAIELKIADAIETRQPPITHSELSSMLGCCPSSLRRVMRFLMHHNIFREEMSDQGTTGYAHTPLSLRLLGPGENTLKDLFWLESSPVMLAPWHLLSSCVRLNGKTPFESAHGVDIWKYTTSNPSHSKLLDGGMACRATKDVEAVIEGCPGVFDGVETMVDVGGGNGTTLGKLVKAFPWIHGINFDLPHVISTAHECEGVSNVGGDMFVSIPKADAAFLMYVLHDWKDDECINILRKCKEAIPEDNGKVIIVEAVIRENKEDKFEFVRLMLDMVMMAHTTQGKERTLEEWEYVLRMAGFKSHTIEPAGPVNSIIEAHP